MDNEVQNSVKSFIKANVRRIQIALAIAIIRSKPEGITAVQHASVIQARFKAKYSNCVLERSVSSKEPVVYDQKALTMQQRQLISSLWEALPHLTTNDPVQNKPQNSQVYQGHSHDMFESEDFMSQVDKNSDASLMEQNELNLRFIQAMIQLKSVVNTCSYISTTELQSILLAVHTDDSKETDELHTVCGQESLISHRSTNQQNTVIHDFPHSEIGFGFGTNRDCNVSGGILKYLMCSSGANHLLVRSVEAVLQYLSQSILTEKSESLDLIFQNWKGSVLEYSLNVVHQLVDHFAQQGEEQNECREVCFTFIRNVIDGILNADSLNMHPLWTQQCCIMVEMGNSKHLCTDFLNYLTDKMQNISRNLKPKAASANNVESEDPFGHKPGDIEKSFYLFYMTEKLLKKWKTFQSSNMSVNKNNTSQVYGANILELWRQNWSLPKSNTNSSGRNDSIERNPASKWKDVLEELVINFTEDYPFITLYAFQCLELLQQES